MVDERCVVGYPRLQAVPKTPSTHARPLSCADDQDQQNVVLRRDAPRSQSRPMTLLVILGAGASHDVVAADVAGKPPLTPDIFRLFVGSLEQYPGAADAWNRVLHGLATPGETIETQLQALRDQADEYDPLKQQLMAVQFFLQDVLTAVSDQWSRNRYPEVVNNLRYAVGKLEQWRAGAGQRILYVTFNYDTLLESALGRELRVPFETTERYLGDERSLIKVHGSCNWKRVADGPADILASLRSAPDVIGAAETLTATDVFHVIASVGQIDLDGAILVPAVSIPVVRKSASEFACPPDHLARLREWLKDVTHVLVIGWAGAEEHFLKELADNLHAGAVLTIVGQPSDDALFKSDRIEAVDASGLAWVKKAGVFGSAGKFHTGFTKFVKDNFDEYVTALPK